MYYGNTGQQGEHPSDFVTELHSQEDLDQFVYTPDQDDRVLTVVDVSLTSASPCIHIFPAVLALAKNFKGYARFARLMGDESPAMQDIIRGLNVIEVQIPFPKDPLKPPPPPPLSSPSSAARLHHWRLDLMTRATSDCQMQGRWVMP